MTDLALCLLRHGYRAVEIDRATRGGGTTYRSRLLGRGALVLGDAEGARLFYDEDVVERRGAVPAPLAWLLFGRGAVHGLDDDEHRVRKAVFLDRLGPGQVLTCATEARMRLERAAPTWAGRDDVDLHDELVTAYGGAVLGWVGAVLDEERARHLSRRYGAIVDGFGFAGPAYPRAWAARRETDRWARGLVADVRGGRVAVADGTVLATLATSALDDRLAGVELGNVVRPTIASSWLGAAAVLAVAGRDGDLDDADVDVLAGADGTFLRWSLAQEIRRITPFVPVLAGRARHQTEHHGVALAHGDAVVLDVRRINLDPAVFAEPARLRAHRFVDHRPGPYEVVPQGGGEPSGHPCPGESLTAQLLAETIAVAARTGLRTTARPLPDLSRIPTRPARRVSFAAAPVRRVSSDDRGQAAG